MVNAPEKRAPLSAFLSELNTASALKLFKSVEAEWARGERDTAHANLLNDLRAHLLSRQTDLPGRRLSAKRIFYTPFEDFFVSTHIGGKRRAQIARTSLDPIWHFLMSEPACAPIARPANALDADILPLEVDDPSIHTSIAQFGPNMFGAAAQIIGELTQRALSDGAYRDQLCEALGGIAIYDDLHEIGLLLKGQIYLERFARIVPANAPALYDDAFYELRELIIEAHSDIDYMATYLVLALPGRMERPWAALEVFYRLAKGADDRLYTAREAVSSLPDSLLESLEAQARALTRDAEEMIDADRLKIQIRYFAEFAGGLLRFAARAGDNVFVNRVEACQEIGAGAHMRIVERASAALRGALPVRHLGGASLLAPPRPDIHAQLSSAQIDLATHGASLLAQAKGLARQFTQDDSDTHKIVDNAQRQLDQYLTSLLREIRAADNDGRKQARRLFDQTLLLAAHFFDETQIEKLREQARLAADTP